MRNPKTAYAARTPTAADAVRTRTYVLTVLAVLTPWMTLATAYAAISDMAYTKGNLVVLSALTAAVPLAGAFLLRGLRAHVALRFLVAFLDTLLLAAALLVVLATTGVQLVPSALTLFASLWVLCWPPRPAVPAPPRG